MTTPSPSDAANQADPTLEIVHLPSEQFTIASEQLATAFSQDPLLSYLLPVDPAAQHRALRHMSRSYLSLARSYGHIYTTAPDCVGVAIWLPPAASHMTRSKLWHILTSGLLLTPFYLRRDRLTNLAALVRRQLHMHEQLMPEPHWYLGMLGVSPRCQGQGVGGRLLKPVLQEADRAQMPCYLETTTVSAVRFYERRGFEVVSHGALADRDYWAMKRNPAQP